MRYLGAENNIVDCTRQENLSEKIFEFVISKEDYFLNMYLRWDRVESDMYRMDVGGAIFDIGCGLYVFAGDGFSGGGCDWFQIDEIIGRNIQVFTVNPAVTRFDFHEQHLKETYYGTYYYPITSNPMPVVSSCGTKMIIVSQTDQHRNLGNKDFYSLFTL